MGLFDKVKNLFTEEIEEEKVVKREVRHVEIPTPRKEEVVEIKAPVVQPAPVKEEKFVFFDDKDFDDLEKKEIKVPVKKEEVKTAYKGTKPYTKPVEEKKIFKPSLIISPIYGVLDKNYKKDDIVSRPTKPKSSYYKETSKLTIDDVRNIAFSTLEDDLKQDLIDNDYIISKREVVEDDLNMFSDVEDTIYDDFESERETVNLEQSSRVRKNEMLFDEDMDEETEFLAKKLAEQRKKLEEISSIISDTDDEPKLTRSKKEELPVKKVSRKLTLDEVLEKAEKKIDEESENITDEEILEQIVEEIIEDEPTTKKAPLNQIDQAFEDAFEDIDSAMSESVQIEDEDMDESELFNLIDSMYEKKEDEE